MAGLSDYAEEAILDDIFNISPWTKPTNMYVALFTAAPSDAGGGTEVSGNAYARVQVTNDGTTWSRSSSTVSNLGPITFPSPSPSDWGTITHVGRYNAASSGDLICWEALDANLVTAAGTAPNFPAGDLTFTLD